MASQKTQGLRESFEPSMRVSESFVELTSGFNDRDEVTRKSLLELECGPIASEFERLRDFREPVEAFKPVTFVKPEVTPSSSAAKIQMRQGAVKEIFDHPGWMKKIDIVVTQAQKAKPFADPLHPVDKDEENAHFTYFLRKNTERGSGLIKIVENLRNMDMAHPYLAYWRNWAQVLASEPEYSKLYSFIKGWKHLVAPKSRTYLSENDSHLIDVAKDIALHAGHMTHTRYGRGKRGHSFASTHLSIPIDALERLIDITQIMHNPDDYRARGQQEKAIMYEPNPLWRRDMYQSVVTLKEFFARMEKSTDLQRVVNYEEIKFFEIPQKIAIASKELKMLSDVPPFKPAQMTEFGEHVYRQIGSIAEHTLQIFNDGLLQITRPLSKKYNVGTLIDLARNISIYNALAKMGKEMVDEQLPCTMPQILPEDAGEIRFEGAYVPSLVFTLPAPQPPIQTSDGRLKAGAQPTMKTVCGMPNDFVLTDKESINVVEGPNNNGKTTYLRGMAQLCLLAQMGGFVPARSAAISPRANIFASIIKADSPKDKMGLYSTQLSFINSIMCPQWLEREASYIAQRPEYRAQLLKTLVCNRSLLLFDEFAIGTDHEEAALRTRVTLDEIIKRGALAMLSTHYHDIADAAAAGQIPYAFTTAMVLDSAAVGDARYTYHAKRYGREGSHGNLLAEKLGVTPESFAKSRALIASAGVPGSAFRSSE